MQFNYQSKELGSDRIANTLAAIQKYGKNCLIIDFGTATTFDVIKNNKYKGGVMHLVLLYRMMHWLDMLPN